jgi:hypothetical protein
MTPKENESDLRKGALKSNFKILSDDLGDYLLFRNFLKYRINNYHVKDKASVDMSYDPISMENVVVGIKIKKGTRYSVSCQSTYTYIEFSEGDMDVCYVNPYGNMLLSFNRYDKLVKVVVL